MALELVVTHVMAYAGLNWMLIRHACEWVLQMSIRVFRPNLID
ncbi:MAG: hypothetical protein WCT12_20545 [Verrucomicrobiota bacterium]|jgi:hypothetical protein